MSSQMADADSPLHFTSRSTHTQHTYHASPRPFTSCTPDAANDSSASANQYTHVTLREIRDTIDTLRLHRMKSQLPNSQLETAVVSDFLDWHRTKRLNLNPHFQRRSVWSTQAKTMLIDTILRGYPIPKIYIRSIIDTKTQIAYREVVDGQQRLRSILEFASGRLKLGRRADEFSGLTYEDLSAENKQSFLAYTMAVEHLFNASDDEVL